MQKLCVALDCSNRPITILITNDEEIHALNLQYRKKDKPTDVLSFASQNTSLPKALQRTSQQNLGDIVISVDTLLRQAKTFQTTPKQELLRLVIHGLLHLLGYEHEKVSSKKRLQMERKEQYLLELVDSEGIPR